MKSKRLLIGSLTCATFWLGMLNPLRGASYEWGFTSGNLNPDLGSGVMSYAGTTASLTTFGTTDGSSVPHINGVPATYMRFPQWPTPAANDASLGYQLELTSTGANGGGSYVNRYTILFDVLVPGAPNWTPLFNTDPSNGNDADWYVAPDGSLGIGDLGYTAAGLIHSDTWYRLGFTADLATGDVRYYVNGTRVFTRSGGSLLDGRFSLYSNADPGPDLRIANENDSSGNYTHAQIYSAIAFTDTTLSDADFAAIGGVRAGGILVPEPGVAALLWLGLGGLFLLRRSRSCSLKARAIA
jgi:hypothetical protein